MLIRMLDNINPESYGIKGYHPDFEWKDNQEYDLDKYIAWLLIDNGDACEPIVEPAEVLYQAFRPQPVNVAHNPATFVAKGEDL